MRFALLAISLSFMLNSEVRADYIVSGPVQGSVCYGLVIKACKLHKVSAVKDDDGNLFEVNNVFKTVSEYNERDGICWITIKSTGLSRLNNFFLKQTFLEQTQSGSYVDLDVEYLVFKCKKR